MQIDSRQLPQSRRQLKVRLSNKEIAAFFDHALENLSAAVKVSGFRAGKAPKELVRKQLSSDNVRDEASKLTIQAAWREITRDLKEVPISDPEVTIEEFDELKSGKIVFEFDIRPAVSVGAWQKISLKATTSSSVSDDDVQKLISSLSQGHAATVIKLGPAEIGDKLEVSFEGLIGGVRQDKLSAANFPVIVGQGTTIPGFDEQLVGLKKGQSKTFALKFPANHFDKNLAAKAAEFKVEVQEVFQVILPELNKEFAEKFGHSSVTKLQEAIRQDIVRQRNDDQFVTQKAKWLAKFEGLVTVEVPISLINAEVERSREAWRQFLQQRHMNEGDWLKSRQLTLEQLEKDWQQAAQSSVKIGLGLAEVAKDLKKELKTNEEFHLLLDELVQKAIR